MSIFLAIYSYVLTNILLGSIFMNILDKKTRYVDDKSIGLDIKYILLFLFCNIFCFLFINKIKEKRKIEHFKQMIRYYERIYSYTDLFKLAIDKEIQNRVLKMKRFLKLKNIKYER